MFGIEPNKWLTLKKWAVVQKVTLGRGYSWLNVPMIGFIAASQFKLLFPAFFHGLLRFALLVVACTLGLWFVGYLDRKMRLLHVENSYSVETNPLLIDMFDNTKKAMTKNESSM